MSGYGDLEESSRSFVDFCGSAVSFPLLTSRRGNDGDVIAVLFVVVIARSSDSEDVVFEVVSVDELVEMFKDGVLARSACYSFAYLSHSVGDCL